MNNRLDILKDYSPDQYNVLLPFTDMELAPYHQVTVQRVKLSTAPDDGDAWPLKSKRIKQAGQWATVVELYAIARRGLDRLVHAAGGRWAPTAMDRDDGLVTASAVLALLSPDGQWQTWPGKYTWDIDERSDAARHAYERDLAAGPPTWYKKSREEWQKEREERLHNELQMIRRHATSRAETGAMLRAARKALGLKPGYTPQELDKEFVLPRVTVNIYELPAFTQAAVSAWLSQQMAIFGAPPQPQIMHPFRPRLQQPRQPYVDPMSDAALEVELANGQMPEPQPEPEADLPVSEEPEGAKHWIDEPKMRARFWHWVREELALTDADVHEALEVESVHEFTGAPEDAKARILRWIEKQAAKEWQSAFEGAEYSEE